MKTVYVFTFLLLLNVSNQTDILARNCEPIRIELCRGIGYNETSMPNLVGHELQTDADFTLQTFLPLIQYGCSAQLHFFLCSTYVPMCTPKVLLPIGPCRVLCETVRARCHPVLEGFGFPWPPALECSRFPKDNNHEHMCMKGPGEPGDMSSSSNLDTSSGIKNTNINTNTNTMYINPNDNGIIGGIPRTVKNQLPSGHQTFCKGLTKSHLYVHLQRSGRCTPLCEADIQFDQNEKNLAEIWATAWSVTALVVAVLATLCLIVYDTNWDRILVPLVTCHFLVAVGWAVRWLAGRNRTACGYDPQLPGVSILLSDGLSNAPCAATFLLRYYFGMAANVWWSILCFKWHLLVRQSRNCVRNRLPTVDTKIKTETHGTLIQLIAWGLPALQTISVLVTRFVDAGELFGACFVGNQSDKALRVLVALPLFCYWMFGSVNLFAGYLVHRRKETSSASLHSMTFPDGIANIRTNSSLLDTCLGPFLFIYCIAIGLMLISVFYEFANRDIWLSVSQEYMPAYKAPMWPFMLRFFVELFVGILASGWTLGLRIETVWKQRTTSKSLPPKLSPASIKYPQPAYSASYQTICPHNSTKSSVISLTTKQTSQKYTIAASSATAAQLYRKSRPLKSSCHSICLKGNETTL